MINEIIKACEKEFRISNCCFELHPIDLIVRSQWQSKTKSHFYVIYRWAIAIFYVGSLINSLHRYYQMPINFIYYLIYLSHWGLFLNVIVGVFGAILVTIWNFKGS